MKYVIEIEKQYHMMNRNIEDEYNEMLWNEWLVDHPHADDDDAIRFWAKIHLSDIRLMRNIDILDALTHFYNGDNAKALDALVERNVKQALEKHNCGDSLIDLD